MIVKYLNNIYFINNHLIKGTGEGRSILLTKNNSDYIMLEFRDTKTRDFVLSQIWAELVNKTETFDIDKLVEVLENKTKYNV